LVSNAFCSNIENSLFNEHIEIVHVSVSKSFIKPLQFVSIYRPPSGKISNFIDYFNYVFSSINFKDFPILIAGDINYDLSKLNKKNDKFMLELNSYGLTVKNSSPTRTVNNSSTCIDWIICNHLLVDLKVEEPIDVSFSDHKLLLGNFKMSGNNSGKEKKVN